MVFVWRGFGIAVPIVFFLSVWITSYWFEDTKLLNAALIGWSMLWAGITLVLFALASFGNTLDENGEPTDKKSYNDFFWIPIWIWSLGFILGSIYLINKAVPDSSSSNYSYTETDSDNESYTDNEVIDVAIEKRKLYLYNCSADSIKIEITETHEEDGTNYNFYVQNNDYEYVTVDPDRYSVQMNDYEQKINLKKSDKRNEKDYDDAWLVLCAEIDLVLVDVTEICNKNVTAEDVAEVTWEDNVVERFNGDDLIEPDLKSKRGGEVKVVAPGYYIPQERERTQRIYALIPIDRADEVSEALLRKKIIKVSVR
ncbi:MAG: hypothetical protein ACI8ZM_004446 [Crocinitomix sp.]|jgi:hypothetical protein